MKDESLFWNKMAEKYSLKPVPNQEIYEEKLRLTRELFNKDMNVLEIGCGTGTTALIHAPYVGTITGADFSSEMIKIANSKAKAQEQNNINFVQESIQDMNYPENEFDIVMAHSILHLVENNNETLEKIYNSLRPGGYFVTTTGCIGLFKIFKPLWYLVFKLEKLPFLNWFTKKEFLYQVTKAGFIIEKEWDPTKVDLFLIAKKALN
jgi:ubiquinone/menaquinone biosynthesis C-methylase UbiE